MVLIWLKRGDPPVSCGYRTSSVTWMVAKIFENSMWYFIRKVYRKYDPGRSVFLMGKPGLCSKDNQNRLKEIEISLNLF